MTIFPELHLRLVPPDGRRIDAAVGGVTAATTLADLAALVTPAAVPTVLLVDGRPVRSATPLVDAGVGHGSELDWPSPGARPITGDTPVVTVRTVGGPDWGRALAFGPGRHVIGRAVPDGGIDDPALAAHHAVVEVDEAGRVAIEDLGVGRPPCWSGDRLRFGAGDVVIEPVAPQPAERAAVTPSAGPWARVWIREAGAPPVPEPVIRRHDLVPPPERPGAAIGIVSTGVAALGGAVMGIVLRQPLLVALSLLGTLGGSLGLGVQWHRDRRARRHHLAAVAAEHDRIAAELDDAIERRHLAGNPSAPWRIGAQVDLAELWAGRRRDDGAWQPIVGIGDLEWWPPIEGGADAPVILPAVAVPLDLAVGAVVAVVGDRVGVARLVRSMVLQAAARFGPADLRIVTDPDGPPPAWARWLPHHDLRLQPDTDDDRTELIVLDSARDLAVRTSAVRRRLDRADHRAIVLVAGAPGDPIPRPCTHVVTVGATHAEIRHVAATHGGRAAPPQRVEPCGVGERSAERIARAMARFVDPELPAARAGLPDRVEFADLLGPAGATPEAIAAAWRAAGPDPAPVASLGVAPDGRVDLDLDRDGPHVLVAGTTGAGKSELLRTLVVGLACSTPPELLQFVLVDYKGGSAFDACTGLPHVAGLVTDLDGRLAERMLASLEAELTRRERALRALGAADLAAARQLGGPAMARLVVVVDEFAALAADIPDFVPSLVGVAQRGRSLGVHLVLATQRPAGVIDDQIRANTGLRLCLRVQDPADALDVVGDRRAAELPRSTPGRAVLRLAGDLPMVFQTACCTGPHRPEDAGLRLRDLAVGTTTTPVAEPSAVPSSLEVLVERIGLAARLGAVASAAAVWTDPLPEVVDAADDVVAEIDDVRGQCRRPLRWRPGTGHLLVAGRRGAGVSTALARVATSLAATFGPDELHLHVIDGAGTGELRALARLPHCGTVADAEDDDALERLIAHLARLGPLSAVPTVVVIDDAGALRNRLATPERAELFDRLAGLVSDGAGAVTFVFGVDHPAAVPTGWQGRCAERWIGVLADPLDASAFGVPASAALRASPPGRFVVAGPDGEPLDAHVATGDESMAARCDRLAARWAGRPVTVARLGAGPATVHLTALPGPSVRPGPRGGAPELPIGLDTVTLDPVPVVFHPGDHGLVLGPPRSGRSSSLRLLADRWETLFGAGTAVLVDGRAPADGGLAGRIDDTTAAGRPCLVLVDDADRYADPDRALADLLGRDRAGVHVVAAARPDALRACGYAHWSAALRRPAWGLLLGSVDDVEADLLGVVLPRRRAAKRPRPVGAGLLAQDGIVRSVTLAVGPVADAQRGGEALAGSTGHECFG